MEPYKKRAKSGWAGKSEMKIDGIRKERQFEKKEINEMVSEYEQGENFRYRHNATVNKNEKLRMEYRISKYKRRVEENNKTRKNDIAQGKSLSCCAFDGYWSSALKKLQKKYNEKYGAE